MSYQAFSFFSTSLVTVSVIFPLVATIVVCLRIYARKLKAQRFGWDDWTTFMSLALCWMLSINLWVFASITGVNYVKINPLVAQEETFKFLWVNEIFFSIVLGMVKISVLLFYKRIFNVASFRLAAWILIAIIGGWSFAILIVSIFTSDPIDATWKNPGHYRIDYNAYSLSVAGMSLAFDVIVLLLPLLVIRTLQMPFRRKLVVVMIFWLGSICCIAGAVRLQLLYQSVYSVNTNPNFYTLLTKAFHWAELEPNMAVIAASLPCLRPLFTSEGKSDESFFAKFRGWSEISSFSFLKRSSNRSQDIDSFGNERIMVSKDFTVKKSSSSQTHLHDDIEMNGVSH